jgi:hypothetical protein
MNRLLRLPHWLVFLYLVIIPPFFPGGEKENYFIAAWGLLFLLWVSRIDKELYDRIPDGVNLSINSLLINLLVSAFYMMVILLITGGHEITPENFQDYGWEGYVYVLMDSYCLFTFFYSIRFTSKAIASIEDNNNAGIARYGKYLAALLFFPIGIWWIQPRVNKILLSPATKNKH